MQFFPNYRITLTAHISHQSLDVTRTWIVVLAFILLKQRVISPPNLHSKFSLNKERRWERGATVMTSEMV